MKTQTCRTFLVSALFFSAATLLWGQVTPTQRIRFNLQDQEGIRTVAFSTNSKRLVAGGDKGTLGVFDVVNGDTWYLPAHPTKIVALAFSYDNRFLASASEDGTFSLYDFQESKNLKLNGAPGIVKDIAFSPTGGVLATATDDGKIGLWDMQTREKTSTLKGRAEKVLSLAFSPDGKLLASGSADKQILLWNVETGTTTNILLGHTDWVRTLSFNENGTMLASGSYDHTIKFWDVATGKSTKTVEVNKDWVTDLHYSPDGQYLISGGGRGQVIILKANGEVVQKMDDFARLVTASPVSNDGKWIAVSDLGTTVHLLNASALNIKPWKPFDIIPPSMAVLSPKLLASRDAVTGVRKSVVHQQTVRLMIDVTDLGGVKEVSIPGLTVTRDPGTPDRYLSELMVPLNTDRVISIVAVDNAGNRMEEKLLIEHKPFSGSVNGEHYFALLIGVQDYASPEITDLDQPLKDLHRLKAVLETSYAFSPKNVEVLENPDRNTLYAKLDELQAKLDKLDNLLIFYAGHGYWDKQLEQGYWLPADAEPNRRSSWLSNGTLRDYIGGINARHTLLITDACFSGGIFKSRAVFENASTAIETLYLRKSRKAMTSGTLEAVPDKSVFIDVLLQRLNDNAEPYVTAEELFSGIRSRVIERSPNNQVPQYGEVGQTGDEGGEFIFIRKN